MPRQSEKEDIRRGIKLILLICGVGFLWSVLTGLNMLFWKNEVISGFGTLFLIVFGLLCVVSLGIISMVEASSRPAAALFFLCMVTVLALPFLISNFGQRLAWQNSAVVKGRVESIGANVKATESGLIRVIRYQYTAQGKQYTTMYDMPESQYEAQKIKEGSTLKIRHSALWPSLHELANENR